jgi:hypothetical protein
MRATAVLVLAVLLRMFAKPFSVFGVIAVIREIPVFRTSVKTTRLSSSSLTRM